MTVSVRRATESDIDDLVTSLTEGFAEDPLLMAIYPTSEQYERLAPRFFRWMSEHTLAIGSAYIVEGQGALLTQPSSAVERTEQEIQQTQKELQEVGGECAEGLLDFMNSARANHPSLGVPHWYGTFIGLRRDARGQRVGSSLFQYSIQDYGNPPSYGESTTPGNLAFWQTQGFKPIGTFTTESGVPLTQIWREPNL